MSSFPVDRQCSAALFPVTLSDPPAAARTGDSERQETASAAASEETGQANLLTVPRRNLTLDFVPRRVQVTVTAVVRQPLSAVSSPQVNVYGSNVSRENVSNRS